MAPRTKIPTVVLDIDDTVMNFVGFLCYLYNRKHGTTITEADLHRWNFSRAKVEDAQGNTVKGTELRKFFVELEPHGLYSALPPIKESVLAMELIKRLGYKIILLTARDKVHAKATEISLLAHNIPYDEILFNADKATHINRLARKHHIEAFADDKFEHVESVNSTDKVTGSYLITKTHNKDKEVPEGATRITDLLEVVRLLPEVKR